MRFLSTIPVVLVMAGCMTIPNSGADDMKWEIKKEYVITRAQSPFRDFSGSYKDEQEAKTVTAAGILARMERWEALSAYALDEEPFLALDREERRVVVNEKYFGTLTRQDATRLRKGEHKVVGTVKEKRLIGEPALVFSFLLEAQIIETYWHIEAHCNLAAYQENEKQALASFNASHIYFTNERNEQKYFFSVELDKKSGIVSVIGPSF
jgi:hypothetical protein